VRADQETQALARAVYSRREILLLDDIFSGLDRATVELLFERLWGSDGLLRRMGTTVIFATHGGKRPLPPPALWRMMY
jgi:ATP-binding cassette subfamily C (CFTR/MRP) protein 1